MTIRVGAWMAESEGNGPGRRSVLWVQGCPQRCPGCWNPQFLSGRGGTEWTVEEAVDRLTRSAAIEGVTFLGGEPFAQPAPLADLAARLRARGLGIMAYSGWTLDELRRTGADARRLLAACDLLVDGAFVATEAAPLLWRGSRNQRVHFLTDRYAGWKALVDLRCREFEVLIEPERVVLTGDPPADLWSAWRTAWTSSRS